VLADALARTGTSSIIATVASGALLTLSGIALLRLRTRLA
jgi:LPXTG-motif cell wall-anchored protein